MSATVVAVTRVVVKYAPIGAEGPNGGYFDLNGRIAW